MSGSTGSVPAPEPGPPRPLAVVRRGGVVSGGRRGRRRRRRRGLLGRVVYESLLTLGGEAEEDTAAAAGSVDGAGKTARAISDDGPRRGNMDEFLSWAFFGTSHASASADPSKVRAL